MEAIYLTCYQFTGGLLQSDIQNYICKDPGHECQDQSCGSMLHGQMSKLYDGVSAGYQFAWIKKKIKKIKLRKTIKNSQDWNVNSILEDVYYVT